MAFVDDINLLSVQHPALAKGLAQSANLDKAFRFLETMKFPLVRMDVIAQDEFSHDVCVPFPEGMNFLVIGVT